MLKLKSTKCTVSTIDKIYTVITMPLALYDLENMIQILLILYNQQARKTLSITKAHPRHEHHGMQNVRAFLQMLP